MKKTFKSKLALLGTVALLAACGAQTTEQATSTTEQTQQVVYNYVKNGTFILNKNGEAITENQIANSTTVIDWYLDPYCPHCTKLEDLIKPELKQIMEDNDVVIRYHLMTFMSARSVDDYSNRAASFILGVVETQPEKALDYLNKIISDSFRKSGVAISDEEFKQAFISIGGTSEEWDKVIGLAPSMTQQVKTATSQAFNDKELANKSTEGSLYVPFIVIGDSKKALNFSGETDSVEFIKQKVREYTQAKNPTADSTQENSANSTTTSSND